MLKIASLFKSPYHLHGNAYIQKPAADNGLSATDGDMDTQARGGANIQNSAADNGLSATDRGWIHRNGN